MIISIGEILFDIFPTYRRLGGAPFNFAFHLKKLGLTTRFISRVGDDADGRNIISALKSFGFDPDDIQIDPQHPTGRVVVQLSPKGVPEFDIRPNAAYDHIDVTSRLEGHVNKGGLLYFGSLIQRGDQGFRVIQQILESRPPQLKCFYDINLRPGGYSPKVIRESLNHADVLKLNEDELKVVNTLLGNRNGTEKSIDDLRHRYRIEMVALTRGAKGSTLFTDDGRTDAQTPPVEHLVDTVGAGDAFAAVLAAGYLNGLPPGRNLEAAALLASRLCGVEGAIPVKDDIYSDVIRLIGD